MKWVSWDDLRRRASRKPTALLLRPRRRELRFESLDDRRMLSGLLPAFGPSIEQVKRDRSNIGDLGR